MIQSIPVRPPSVWHHALRIPLYSGFVANPTVLRPIPSGGRRRRPRRRDLLLQRGVPVILLAGCAFFGGAVTGARHEPDELSAARAFGAAWGRGDYTGMHGQLDPATRRRVDLREFTRLYRSAANTATLRGIQRVGPVRRRDDGTVEIPVRARTKLFGTLGGALRMEYRGDGETGGLAWARHMVFPGLNKGEKLTRTVRMPPRGSLQARDGTVLAQGPDRLTPGLDPLVAEVAGRVGPIPEEEAAAYRRKGYPPGAIVGLSGLERELETRLAGTPGGELKAGARTLASVEPKAAGSVRSSIDPEVQRAAVTALAGRLGGIAVLRPRSGEVLALAGIAFSAPQPPGSTFKIVTLAGALENGTVKRSAKFPVTTATTLEGVELENANGESCGGSLGNSFAHSCNSVFAPLGAELGAKRLVETAERFGFNQKPSLVGAQPSTIPAAEELGDDLGVGSTAIGQGRLLATPLHLATVAAAIANRGELVWPTVLRGGKTRSARATTRQVARTIDRFMRRVVTDGTGTAAAIKGVTVAGKTGTAELRDTTPDDEDPVPGATPQPVEEDTTDTDAWFVTYAPAQRPRIAVAVLLVGQGTGGDTAAPAAREVLLAGLKRGG